jgi:hypothetical protein
MTDPREKRLTEFCYAVANLMHDKYLHCGDWPGTECPECRQIAEDVLLLVFHFAVGAEAGGQ